ncbi:putative MFS transporter Liz1/Seo1 [Wallemia mellicola]|nr:putative MFS transporter Liz1/Seo1 [Wallemia mellicola]
MILMKEIEDDVGERLEFEEEYDVSFIRKDLDSNRTFWSKYIWDSLVSVLSVAAFISSLASQDKDPRERKFLFKLDVILISLLSLGFFCETLDASNVTNAYGCSGMREELGFQGNQYNTMLTTRLIGYAIGQIPSNLILTRLSPRYWLPFCEVMFSVFTFACCAVKSPTDISIIRFFVGLFQSSFYPGALFVVGNFYRKDELAKRGVLFISMAGSGQIFSGILQSAAYTNLDGVMKRSGWRWMFIIDGIISLPIAMAGFLLYPSFPDKIEPGKIWSAYDIAIMRKRMELEDRKSAAKFTKSHLVKIFGNWKVWILPWLMIFFSNTQDFLQVYTFWLSNAENSDGTSKYTVPQINLYPNGQVAIFIVWSWVIGWLSDGAFKGNRWIPIVFTSSFAVIVAIVQAALPTYSTNESVRIAFYYLVGIGISQGGLMQAWINELCSESNEERAIILAFGNDFASTYRNRTSRAGH